MKDNNRKIILVGGGGHALSLMESLPEDVEIAGYTSLAPSEKINAKWIGDECADPSITRLPLPFHIAFIYSGVPRMDKRRAIIERFQISGARFASLISPLATVTPNSVIGDGCALLSGAIVNRATLSSHVVVNTGAIVEHDCVIGENTFIGPGAVIGGGVTIGKDCFIGLGVKIRNGIRISSGITVGMGAIVTRDLTEPGIYHGTPLRFHPFE
ncbi:MAG: transferase [Muribaculaceae bacterium]|nr:transferase [Muribaculaceae bacterium]